MFIFVGSGGGALRHTHEDTAAGRLNLSREIIFGGRGGSEFHPKIRALRPLCISFAEKEFLILDAEIFLFLTFAHSTHHSAILFFNYFA